MKSTSTRTHPSKWRQGDAFLYFSSPYDGVAPRVILTTVALSSCVAVRQITCDIFYSHGDRLDDSSIHDWMRLYGYALYEPNSEKHSNRTFCVQSPCMSRASTSGAGPKQVLTRLLSFGAWHRHAGVLRVLLVLLLKGHLIPIWQYCSEIIIIKCVPCHSRTVHNL